MAKYLLAYKGGGGIPETEAEREKAMQAWGSWFQRLGAAVTDGGNPFSVSKTIATNGSVKEGGSASLTGYSILTANNIAAAIELTKGCPIFAHGGSIDVYETIPVEAPCTKQ